MEKGLNPIREKTNINSKGLNPKPYDVILNPEKVEMRIGKRE